MTGLMERFEVRHVQPEGDWSAVENPETGEVEEYETQEEATDVARAFVAESTYLRGDVVVVWIGTEVVERFTVP